MKSSVSREKFRLSGTIIDEILWSLVKTLDLKCMVIFEKEKPYLARFYLHDSNEEISIYLHYFFRSDDENFMHNHPWEKSFSIILTGGYIEEWFHENETTPFVKKAEHLPGDMNVVFSEKFHRVHLKDINCWTLFVGFKKQDGWCFWDKINKKYDYWLHRNNKVKEKSIEIMTARDSRIDDYKKDAFLERRKNK